MAETEIETGDSQGLKVSKKQNIFEANDDSIIRLPILPGESQGQRSLVGCRLWDLTESDTTEVT